MSTIRAAMAIPCDHDVPLTDFCEDCVREYWLSKSALVEEITCVSCLYPVDETELAKTKRGPMCLGCAESAFQALDDLSNSRGYL